jgi:hypothetical protein
MESLFNNNASKWQIHKSTVSEKSEGFIDPTHWALEIPSYLLTQLQDKDLLNYIQTYQPTFWPFRTC